MEPIQEAIEYLELREARDNVSYCKVAKIFGVNQTTLSQRHRGVQRSYRAQAQQQLILNPQQEEELVRYIEGCTRNSLPPARSMLQNFGSPVTQSEVSDSWITQFLHRHADKPTTKWSTGINCERHYSDSKHKYEFYCSLIHPKMRERSVDKRNITYPTDESVTGRVSLLQYQGQI
ncbi:uncharacterized protein M421DRAFT_70558 [Didymella exigua CBS 183.55]|uniref:HTH CENPB-type domain-containing protein n=1 Tax=Didymella exigua CBS 183.55 TaxID=1150837 RepID=A0A6A5RAH7_9PLEO|nr:uncharacterized protein M421DRAFT_70558 [Didymella exigua CBS 183.55]KAF1925221.1 hypothetical protein M421DRAFT_70558 [Didymella exigua CBS 183.55]